MSEGDPPDDEPLDEAAAARLFEENPQLFAETLARAFAQQRARARIARGPDRRVADRRGLGFTARREQDAEWNRQSRAVLFQYLRGLPRAQLLLWIDGLWLGTATDRQLQHLLDAAARETTPESRRTRGRPRALPSPLTDRAQWRAWRDELRAFSRWRRYHYHPPSQRLGRARRVDYERVCRDSVIGQRAIRLGVFATFFGDEALTPGQMAAYLMHAEYKQALLRQAQADRATADAAPTADRRELRLHGAARLEAEADKLPSPETVYQALKGRPRRRG